jgi:hypothetical protein
VHNFVNQGVALGACLVLDGAHTLPELINLLNGLLLLNGGLTFNRSLGDLRSANSESEGTNFLLLSVKECANLLFSVFRGLDHSHSIKQDFV